MALGIPFKWLWMVADGCEHEGDVTRTRLHPQTRKLPELNEHPSLHIRAKNNDFAPGHA